ncbi:MAG: patatin-like protein [Desertimonas sp.]
MAISSSEDIGDEQRRELRIAPVMTGGTSLAVWMGGVTFELYSLLRADEDDGGVGALYRTLLDVTATTVQVDVVTGTSAGGLNGSLLAAAVAWRVPMRKFRSIATTWMEAADLDELLRSPSERDPVSLLRGDEYFGEYIARVLRTWMPERLSRMKLGEVDLVTTYTAVRPVVRTRSDDFDERVHEVDFAGTLRFRREHFRQADIVDRLAIASRTSASIPGVFEPSFLPSSADQAMATGRPDFSIHQPASVRGLGRWAVDGGLVVNLPLTEALDRIFERRARSVVRRVVLYVAPTPMGEARRENDDHLAVPPLRETALVAISAPRAEGIAGDLDVIRRRNQQIERQRLIRSNLRALIPALDHLPSDGPGSLYALYLARRVESSLTRLLERLAASGAAVPFDERLWRARRRDYRRSLLPATIDQFPSPPGPPGVSRPWGWGIAPVEEAGSAVIGLINRVLALSTRRDATALSEAEAGAATTGLGEIKGKVHDALRETAEIRALDDAYWRESADDIGDRDPYRDWPFHDSGPSVEARRIEVFERLRRVHASMASALLAAEAPLRSILDAITATSDVNPGDGPGSHQARASALRDELDTMLGPVGADGKDRPVPVVQRRLLFVHVASTVMLDDVIAREQPAEFLQISSHAPNLVGEPRTSSEKLVGTELARLGAFLKPSWRANDWFWGRMDGAVRMTQALLEPERLWDLGWDPERLCAALGIAYEGDVVTELAYLEPPDEKLIPARLPAVTRAVARRLQERIAAEELPRIAMAIDRSVEAGGNEGVVLRAFKDRVKASTVDGLAAADQLDELVTALPVGDETVGSELGSRMTVRTLTRTAGVAVNLLSSQRSGLGAAARVVRPLRAPLHGANALINMLAGSSPLARGVTAFVLAAAGAIVAVRMAGVAVSGPLVALASLLVFGAFAVALVRNRTWWLVPALAALMLPVALALVGEDVGEIVYSERAASTSSVDAGATIHFDAPTVVMIDRSGGGPTLTEEVMMAPGTDITVREGAATVNVPGQERHEPGWKNWFFLQGVGGWLTIGRALLALGALLALARIGRHAWLAMGALIALTALAVVLPHLARPTLTGEPGERWLKDRVVSAAEGLADWKLPVLVTVSVAVLTVIGLGWDQVIGRAWRARRARRAAATG